MRIKLRDKLPSEFPYWFWENNEQESWRILKDAFGICGLSAMKHGNKIRGKIYLKISDFYFRKERASQK